MLRLRFRLRNFNIRAGLENVQWAGRFEIIDDIIIDGAHNPHGALALRESLDKNFPAGKRFFIFGALADKNISAMIKNLFRADDFVIATEPISSRAESVENLCDKLNDFNISCVAEKNILLAVDKLKNFDGVKIVAGSLYLIGEVRRLLLARH